MEQAFTPWDQSIFADTPAARKLLHAAGNGKLPHAVLLIAPPYSGVEALARHAAAVLLCTGNDAPCGQCNACAMVRAEKHPDFMALSGAQKSIRIQEVRDIRQRLYTASALGNDRVALFLHADNMTPQAQNSLLKILEGPPAGVRFILTSCGEKRVLPTIVSRCAVLRIGYMPLHAVRKALCAQGADADTAELYANASMGRLQWAQALFENAEYRSLREQAQVALSALLNGEAQAPLRFGAFMSEARAEADWVFWCMASILYDALHMRLRLQRELYNADNPELVRSYAGRFTIRQLKGMIKEMINTQSAFNRYMNVPLQIDALAIKLGALAAQDRTVT